MFDLVAAGMTALHLSGKARQKRRSPKWGLLALALGVGCEWGLGFVALAVFDAGILGLLGAMLVGLVVGLVVASRVIAHLAEGPSDRLPQARVISR